MAAASTWNAFVWNYLSSPAHERGLYQRVKRARPTRIVEVGLGDLTRASRVIALAQRYSDEPIQYCGIDPFDARDDQPLRLKEVHKRLSQAGAKVRLVPGDFASGVARTANLLSGTDLLIIDSAVSRDDLESMFPFFPRLLVENTSIARISQQGKSGAVKWMKPDSFAGRQAKAA